MPSLGVQSRSFSDPAGYGAQLLTFEQFDPALGALGGVRAEISATVSGSVLVENLEGRAVSLTYGAQAWVDVFAPGAARLTSETVAGEQTVTLPAYDGTVDFSGASGTRLAVVAAVDGVSAAEASGTVDEAPFVGTGSVALTVTDFARNRIAGPANMRVQAEAAVGGVVRLAYDYTPAAGIVDGGGGGGVIIEDQTRLFGPLVTVTTVPQVFRVSPRPTGWQEALAVGRFDPALGTLLAVQVRLVSVVRAEAAIENHGAQGGTAEVVQDAATTLVRDGVVLAGSQARVERTLRFGVADGVDDFAGTGGIGEAGWTMTRAHAVTLIDAASRAAFSGGGTVSLGLDSQGVGEIVGPARFLAEIAALSGAVVEVAYTYLVESGVAGVMVADAGTNTVVAAQAYRGPVADLLHQFIAVTPDNLVISANTDSWFIRAGAGTDAIAARGGTNVIDGGGGSNFLTGGFGRDVFFVDLRGAEAAVWSTIANLQASDEATLWGLVREGVQLSWVEDAGAVGARGLTLHAVTAGRPTASLTLAGYTTADLTNGRLTIGTGVVEGNAYLHISAA